MRCHEIRQQLAVYRELSISQKHRLQEHLALCPECAATLAAYEAQDQVLAALPVLSPSPGLAMAVHGRTVGQRRLPRRFSWRNAAVVVSLLLFGMAWGSVGVAARALPGDALYPLKQAAEQVRLMLTLDLAARDDFRQQLAETRREEVRAVVRLKREARVEFQGDLAAIDDGVWVVAGFQVHVGVEAWAGAPPPVRSTVAVDAQAASGQLKARRVRVLERPAAMPTPAVSPTVNASPAPTPTSTSSPVRRPSAGQATARLTATRRVPEPTAARRGTEVPGPGAQPSSSPGFEGPGPQRSITPGPRGPGAQASATHGPAGPAAQASTTPRSVGPGPQGSATPGPSGSGAQPSATPGAGAPVVQPSATPGPGGPGGQPSVTPGSSGPGPQPSATRVPSGPGAQPSATPGPSGLGPQPSPTPGRGGR